MNYIRVYKDMIDKGDVIVSDKVRRLYAHLVAKLDNEEIESRYIFNSAKAEYAIAFIERFCKHSKGKWAGKPVLLEIWQKALVSALFGFVDKDTGLRQYRELILIVARKNGKSTLASALGLYLLIADGEGGPEIYSAATKRDQAKIIWDEAVRMVKKSPALSKRNACKVSRIQCLLNEGKFEPVSSESKTLDGLNVHGALIDELHAIEDKNLYDVIFDGMTAREQPLMIITSTAGTVRENIYDLKYDEASAIVSGYGDTDGAHDEHVLPIIYELDSRKEWTEPTCWQKANPALGTVKDVGQLRDKVERAKKNPLYVKNLLTKDFNIRETSTEAFLTFEQLNNTAEYDLNVVRPKYAIGGIDLSTTTDLTCATVLWCDADAAQFYVKQMYWIPEELLEKRVKEDKVPYDIWKKRGLLNISPGNTIDQRLVLDWFKQLQYEEDIYIYKVGYDSWSASYFVKEMEDTFGTGVMDPVIQGKKTLSMPMRELGALLDAKRVNYNNNPILKWCMANVAVDVDRNNNIQPAKGKSQRRRIDGFASLLDAYVTFTRFKDEFITLM